MRAACPLTQRIATQLATATQAVEEHKMLAETARQAAAEKTTGYEVLMEDFVREKKVRQVPDLFSLPTPQ